jgi:hypothetical protein
LDDAVNHVRSEELGGNVGAAFKIEEESVVTALEKLAASATRGYREALAANARRKLAERSEMWAGDHRNTSLKALILLEPRPATRQAMFRTYAAFYAAWEAEAEGEPEAQQAALREAQEWLEQAQMWFAVEVQS